MMVDAITAWVQAVVAANIAAEQEAKKEEGLRFRQNRLPLYEPALKALADLRDLLPVGQTRGLWAAYQNLVSILPPLSGYFHPLKGKDFQTLTPEKRAAISKHLDEVQENIDKVLDSGQWLVDEAAKVLRRLQPYLKPGVGPSEGKDVIREFPVDLRGWRYADVASRYPKEMESFFRRNIEDLGKNPAAKDVLKLLQDKLDDLILGNHPWSKIKVRLTPQIGSENVLGSWNEGTKTLSLKVRSGILVWELEGRLREVVRHELQHFTQSLLNEALGRGTYPVERVPGPGMPSRHIMTPKFRQTMNPPRGMTEVQVHALDDLEFFSRLSDAIRDAQMVLRDTELHMQDYYKRDLTSEERKAHLTVFMGMRPRDAEMRELTRYTPMDPFFMALLKYAKDKWKRAAKELLRKLL